jgi:hypothetical protein
MKLAAASLGPAVVIAMSSCTDSPTGLEYSQGMSVPVRIQSVTVDASQAISGVTLTVAGPGIPTPLVFALGAPDTAGITPPQSFAVPAGPDRVFTGKAFVGGVQSHEGVDTLDVTRDGVTVSLYLKKLMGNGPIGAAVEDFKVEMDDSTAFRAAVDTTRAAASTTPSFTARVTYSVAGGGHQKGDPVPTIPVAWASDNPGVAAVVSTNCTTATNGSCTIQAAVANGARAGSTVGIVATAAGVAKRVVLIVP